MVRLYTNEEGCRWQRRARVSLGAALGLLAAALGVCIFLCTRLTTANAQTLLLADIALFTLAGWVCMLVLYFIYAPAKAQATHIAGMMSQEPEMFEGTLTLRRETFHIPKSITVRKADLRTADGTLLLSVSNGLCRQLPQGKKLRVWTVRKYITAYEVME